MGSHNSIEEIKKVFTTNGSKPVLILCDDYNDWICKYDKSNKLFNEYLASSFLKLWDIPTPIFSIVNILQEHIPIKYHDNRIHPNLFKKPCFGSQHLPFAQDITDFFKVIVQNNYERGKIANINGFLKIALFDIWIANEDRNSNNPNLLLNPTPNGYEFTAIDHSDIFNCNNLQNGLSQLTFEDSILYADFTKIMTGNQYTTADIINDMEKEYYLCIEKCRNNVEKIVKSTPPEWGLNTQEEALLIKNSIIENDKWLKDSLANFKQYLVQSIS